MAMHRPAIRETLQLIRFQKDKNAVANDFVENWANLRNTLNLTDATAAKPRAVVVRLTLKEEENSRVKNDEVSYVIDSR